MSHKIGDVPSVKSVESNTVASLLFYPTVDRTESMTSEFFRLKRCFGASLDAISMVLMKSVL